ncbi:hypothetical protein BJX68DRAFT_234718 [Aspergillus pseudodeflectus]|uniref:Uncharacterized protein n=1 Tax=Aspergillus pseudodeflectus TaxID=176178 RepID=A0ABR4KKE6_9EURO
MHTQPVAPIDICALLIPFHTTTTSYVIVQLLFAFSFIGSFFLCASRLGLVFVPPPTHPPTS